MTPDRRDSRSRLRWSPREESTDSLRFQMALASMELLRATGDRAIAAESWKRRCETEIDRREGISAADVNDSDLSACLASSERAFNDGR